jgi:hypothetical protein
VVRRLLGVEEVEQDPQLRLVLASQLFFFFVTFLFWSQRARLSSSAVADFNYLPTWPLEQLPCIFVLPPVWAKLSMQLVGLGSLLACLHLIRGGGCDGPMGMLLVAFWVKLYYYLGDLRQMANFDHVHLILTAIFLVSNRKLFFFRIGLWLIYLLAAVAKLTPSWLFGEYFRSVPAGLPFFPRAFIEPAGLTLIALEVLGPLAWLSSRSAVRKTSVGLFVLFHYYSGIIVGHWYTTLMLPSVAAAFVRFDRPIQDGYRWERRQLLSWIFVGLWIVGGFYNFLIPGDVRLTAEGRYMGLFMFDANRRVVGTIDVSKGPHRHVFHIEFGWPVRDVLDWSTLVYEDRFENGVKVDSHRVRKPVSEAGQVIFNPEFFTGASSRQFGDPYFYFYYGRELCARFHPDHLRITMDQQLDGNPYVFRVVDIEDFVKSRPTYNPFWHNAWIRLPGPDAPPDYRWP